MKVKNIISEALDLTGLQGQVEVLKKSYNDLNKNIQANPVLAKEYAQQNANMGASLAGLDKSLVALLTQQKTDTALADKQKQIAAANQTKPGTTQSLAQQATKPATPVPAQGAAPQVNKTVNQ